MTEIKLTKRYPQSRTEDIVDAYMRGWNDALDAVQNGKFIINDDRKTENSSEKPNNCEYAENPSGDVWECGCFLDTYCEHQIYDINPDGTINIVECGYEPKDEPQTESTGSPIGDYRDGVGAWQTDCEDRYAVRNDSGEVVAHACPLGCEQTDCPWK